MQSAAAYDALAPRYDELERENRILSFMRARSLAAIVEAAPEGGRLLELGAGTGAEACAVARARGARVVAVEPAPALAARARAKAEGLRLEVEVIVSTASEALHQFTSTGERFDGAWSSFALGYDVPLGTLRPALASLLRPGAPAVLSVRNPWCLAEPWSIPARATGRYRHRVGGARVPLRHYSLRAASRALAPEFVLERAQGLPVLVPPPRYGAAWNRLAGVAAAVENADRRLASRAPFNALGDHTLLVFRRA